MNSDGTIVAIGAHTNDGNGSNSGHVRVYQYSSGSWSQLGSDIDGEEPAGPVPHSHGDFSGFWRAFRNLHHSAACALLVFDSRGLQALLRMVVARYSTPAERVGSSRLGTCRLIGKRVKERTPFRR